MSDLNQSNQMDKLACDAIRDLVGRVLTLSTALIAAAVALGKIFGADQLPITPFAIGLICFAMAIFFGLLTLMTIISSIANDSIDVARNKWVSAMLVLHLVSFFCGILSVIWLTICIVQ